MTEKTPLSNPDPPPQQTTVIVQQPIAVTTIQFKDKPVTFVDSSGQQVTTQLEFRNGLLVWLIFGAICLFTGLICLAIIPFFIDDLKDVYHINPKDGNVVGVFKRLS